MICIVAVLLQTLMMNALHVVLFSVAALLGLGVLVHSKQMQYYEQPIMQQPMPMMQQQQVGYADAGYGYGGYGGDMGQYVMMPAGYGGYGGSGGFSMSLGGGGMSWWIWFIREYFFIKLGDNTFVFE